MIDSLLGFVSIAFIGDNNVEVLSVKTEVDVL